MSKRFMKSFFIRVLLTVFVLSIIPPKSFATSTTIPVENADAKVIKTDPEQNSNLQTGELVEERTANTKTFYNGNGKYTKKIYFEPIHMQEDGKENFEEISPELTKDDTKTNIVTTENTVVDTEFLKTMSNGKYANFSYEGHSMSLSILQASGEGKTPLEASDVNAQFVEDTNKIVHEDIFPQIDLQNFTFNQNTKEDLVLHEYNGYHVFKFKILTDLKAEVDESGNILMKDEEGNKVFDLPKPYMSDSNIDSESGEASTSSDVDFSIDETEEGYILTLNANADWLASPERKFPIFIDPSFSVTNSYDAFVMGAYPDTNYSSTSSKWDSGLNQYVLKVGNYDSTTGNSQAFLAQPIDKFVGLNITSATFNAYVTHSASSTATGLWINRINEPWSVSGVTYNNRPASANFDNVSVKAGEWATFDATYTLKSWLNGTNSNYGFMLHTNGNGQSYWKKIVSTSNSNLNPYISINYTIPTPVLNVDSLKTYYNADGTGYFTLNWDKPSAGAKGYNVWIYNGNGYQSFKIDDGNITTFTTKGKKIWPSKDQIDAGKKTLYTDGVSGQEFPTNPDYLYAKTGGAYPTTKHYWFRISVIYADGIGESDMSNALTPTIFDKPQAPIGKAFTNMVSEQSGYVNLNWNKNLEATGYKVYIYNGKSYEAYDVENSDTWTTQNKGIWPLPEEIQGHTNVPLHHPVGANDTNYGGTELPLDPSPLYRTYATSYPNNKNYWFRISQYDEHGESPYSATAYTPTIGQPVPFLGIEDYWTYVDVPRGSVNVGTGNYVTSEIDFSLDGRGPGIEVSRTYNSQSNVTGVFGLGWHSNLDSSIQVDGTDLIYTDDDGTILRFTKNTTGQYVAPPGTYLTLKDNGTNYTLEDTSQTIITFDYSTGKIKSITDKHNNKTTFVYTGGKLVTIEDATGRKVNIGYKTTSGLTDLIDTIKYSTRIIQYEYNSSKLLSNVQDPEGSMTEYQFDSSKRLNKIIGPTDGEPIVTQIDYQIDSEKVEKVTDPKGYVTSLKYNEDNNNLTVTLPSLKQNQYWYNANANPTKVIEDVGGLNITSSTNYVNNNLEQSINPQDYSESKISESYSYDEKGNVKTTNTHYGLESFTYNNDNNLTNYKDTEDKTYRTSYDSKKNPISSFDTTNATASGSVYDVYGNEVESVESLSAASNLLINSTFENGTNGWTVFKANDSGTMSIDTIGSGNIGGNKSIKLTTKSTSTTANQLGYIYVQQSVNNIKENTNYTISSKIKTNLTEAQAFYNIYFYDASGTKITSTTNRVSQLKGEKDWTNLPFTFKTPTGTTKIDVYLQVDHYTSTASGDVWFDNVQLEKSEFQSLYNPVVNGGFENLVTSWSGAGGTNESTDVFDGSSSLKIVRVNSSQPSSEYKQTIIIGQKITEKPLELTLTGLSKSLSVLANGTKDSKDFTLKATANYTDGTNKTFYANFTDGTNEWNRVYQSINTTDSKPIDKIELSIVFGGNFTGTAWFDGIRLIESNHVSKTNYTSDGNYVHEIFDPTNATTTYDYDSFGNIYSAIDSLGNTKSYEYYNDNQIEKVTYANGGSVQYSYYPNGLIKNSTFQSDDPLKSAQVYQYSYDKNGNLENIVDSMGLKTVNLYDKNNNLLKSTLPSGIVIDNTFDGTNRLKTTSFNTTKYFEYEYDNDGYVTFIDNYLFHQKVTRILDDQKRLELLTDSRNDNQISGTQSWDFDSDSDKLNSSSFTRGSITEMTSYSYNSLDQNTTVSSSNKNFKFYFDEFGNVNYYLAGNNSYSSYQYNNRNFVDSYKVQLENGTTILDESYQYDKNGNRTEISKSGNVNIKYSYDEMNQLETEEFDDTLKEYLYDDYGNRTKVSITKNSTTTHTNAQFNDANQLINYGNQIISYDLEGNRKQDGNYVYGWNLAGQLISVKKIGDSSPFATYQYDEQDRRIQKTVNGKVTNYYYDGDSNNVLYETDSSGIVLRSYIYSADGYRLAMKTQGQIFYYHYNGHGDVVALTDDSDAIVATYSYDAWGNVISSTGTGLAVENPFGYAGYMYDKELKMYYLIARYYQPEQGVFLSLDSDPGTVDNLASQNGFTYGNNNPVMYFDFDGNAAQNDGQTTGVGGISGGGVVAGGAGYGAKKAIQLAGKKIKNGIKTTYKVVKNAFKGKVSAEDIVFSDKFKKAAYKNQVSDRGWTKASIAKVINKPYKISSAVNKYTKNKVTVYFKDKTHYVAVDNGTKKVIQVSDLNKSNWKFDPNFSK